MATDFGGIMVGYENGIAWDVNYIGDPVIITLRDEISGDIIREEKYQCVHPPVFGLDTDDVRDINKLLDKMLKEAKK